MAQTNTREALICTITGDLKLTIVPPWERLLVYVGSEQGLPSNYSPVDFFNPDYNAHENFRTATAFDIVLKDGDCLYLPSYWWYQQETSPEAVTTVVTFWYTVSSVWLKMMFHGLEEGSLV
jgi:hypothetical protein